MSRRQRDRERHAAAAAGAKGEGGAGRAITERGRAAGASTRSGLSFTRWTGIFGGAALLTILGGFVLLAQGSLTLAPILLVVGFLVLVPLALVR